VNYFLFGLYNKSGVTKRLAGAITNRYRFTGGSVCPKAGRSQDRVPMRRIFSNLPNPSGRTMGLGSTQPLTGMSTRNLK
jgi:hypothetical protein